MKRKNKVMEKTHKKALLVFKNRKWVPGGIDQLMHAQQYLVYLHLGLNVFDKDHFVPLLIGGLQKLCNSLFCTQVQSFISQVKSPCNLEAV